MKYLIKIISLLLFSGLILPIGQYNARQLPYSKKHFVTVPAGTEMPNAAEKLAEKGFSFFNNVAANILPVLKNLI